jgi:hypothetical protein
MPNWRHNPVIGSPSNNCDKAKAFFHYRTLFRGIATSPMQGH